MKNDEVKRHPTSDALVQLRKALGKTQQTFAVEVLNCAIGTVARYETSLPPEGVVLVQLAYIAFQHNLPDIGNVFLMAFFDEVKSRLAKFPDLSAKEGRGYVFSLLDGWHEINLLQCCLAVKAAFHAKEGTEHRKVADDALAYMQRAAKKVLPPLTYKIGIGYGEAVVAAINASTAADKNPTTTTTPPKRKKK